MKIYVAGRTTDLRTVTNIAEGLEDAGHEITFKWYDPEKGEIRHGSLTSRDIELIPGPYEDPTQEDVEWEVRIRHTPTGLVEIGTGMSQVAASDVAVNRLRARLNAGWSADPDKATALAETEMAAVYNADAVVLVWAPDLLGSAIEVGGALMLNKRVWIFRPGRDSVFWYLPTAKIIWSKTELMEDVEIYETERHF